mmetsp:Transcript_41290/g.87949  ORF Transcript_41290/g.87949 Transcript_41290/m.87949 type:complete len:137 (-) Transcript_41290:110-520(-)
MDLAQMLELIEDMKAHNDLVSDLGELQNAQIESACPETEALQMACVELIVTLTSAQDNIAALVAENKNLCSFIMQQDNAAPEVLATIEQAKKTETMSEPMLKPIKEQLQEEMPDLRCWARKVSPGSEADASKEETK